MNASLTTSEASGGEMTAGSGGRVYFSASICPPAEFPVQACGF